MYPAFTTTRPRLPSILSVSEPLEQYRAWLGKRGRLDPDAIAALDPLDAYLAYLLLDRHPGEPMILDLTSQATAGVGALLGLLHPREPVVFASPQNGQGAYRDALEEYLVRQEKSHNRLRWFSGSPPLAELQGNQDVIIFLDGSCSGVEEQVDRWLNLLPECVALVFGLGQVGDSPAIDALLRRFPSDSRRRFRLLRDCGETLSASRLGMASERENASAEVALLRVKQLFTGNYSFLGMLRSVTEQAMRETKHDAALQENHVHFLEWNQEINHLKHTAHTREEELRSLRASASYRLSEQLIRWRSRFVPDQSWRYRVFRLFRRAAQIWRQGGVRSVLHRIACRCLRRKP